MSAPTIKSRRYHWRWNEATQAYDLAVTGLEYVEGELLGRVPSTLETESKVSEKGLDTA